MKPIHFATTLPVVTMILILGLVALVRADVSQSQSNRGERIAQALNLTDSQTAQLKPILSGARAQFKAIHDDQSLAPDQKRQKIKALKKLLRSEVDQILTPAQQQKLAAIMAKFHIQHRPPAD
jgi:Spy/CpxP family protein refolding chaperone